MDPRSGELHDEWVKGLVRVEGEDDDLVEMSARLRAQSEDVNMEAARLSARENLDRIRAEREKKERRQRA